MVSHPKPHQLAQGFDTIIVNGKVARREGKMSESYFGKVLKPN